ncbi:MAG: glutamate racemase [Flavobacteriales bacterium]
MISAGDPRPIGIFDSGIGGLTVAQAIQQALPNERLLYFGDNANIPYGEKTNTEILRLSRGITAALLEQGCKLIVIACNTASAAALKPLRAEMPEVTFIGMEPAVKPAVEHTRTGVVGVIATVATVQGEVFASIVERFGQDVQVIKQACPGLVRQIEAGEYATPKTEAMLRGWLEPMMAQGIDALVLGCTHYPFVRPLIERIVGSSVRVIDPAPAIARRVEHVLREASALSTARPTGGMQCLTSGDPALFKFALEYLEFPVASVSRAPWSDGRLSLAYTTPRT